MKVRLLSVLCALAVGASLCANFAVASDKKTAEDKKQEGGKPAAGDKKEMSGGPDAAMMEAMAKAGTPGQFHEHLKAMTGTWTYEGKFYFDPSAPPSEDKGTCESKMVMGGRYLVSNWKGTSTNMGPVPFEGMGIWGYDNTSKKYASSWTDNMSTMIMNSEGTCDGSGKTFTMTSNYFCPVMNKPTTSRSVTTILGDGKYKMEMFGPGMDGKEMKQMEISCTRK